VTGVQTCALPIYNSASSIVSLLSDLQETNSNDILKIATNSVLDKFLGFIFDCFYRSTKDTTAAVYFP